MIGKHQMACTVLDQDRPDLRPEPALFCAETSDYYVLGFYSGNADPTARTRRLRVEVDRADVEVQSRTHYTYARAGAQAAALPRP